MEIPHVKDIHVDKKKSPNMVPCTDTDDEDTFMD
jgi:hypothetical protein